MEPMAAAHALVRAMPDGTAVVDEAITTGVYVRGFHHWTEPGRYFFCKGGGLGWGMPAALGVSLACDGSVPVLCVVGDGSAMYSPQALWTAAHERLPVVFAVVVNRQYLILKNYLREHEGRQSVAHDRFVAMDLDDPPLDFVALGRVDGRRRHARRATPATSATPCAAALGHRAARTSLEIPITVPGDGRRPSLRAARRRRRCETVGPSSTTSTGTVRDRRALGRARPQRLGQDHAACASPSLLPAPHARATVEVLGQRARARSTSARCAPASGWRRRRWPTSSAPGLTRADVVMTAQHAALGAVVAHLHRRGPRAGARRCSTASASAHAGRADVRHAVVGRAPAGAAGPHAHDRPRPGAARRAHRRPRPRRPGGAGRQRWPRSPATRRRRQRCS